MYVLHINYSPDGEDYSATNLTLVFTEANLRQCVTIFVVDDSIIEMDEQLLVELVHPESHAPYELLQGSTRVMIEDNDGEHSEMTTT